jgi:hypothetical protein
MRTLFYRVDSADETETDSCEWMIDCELPCELPQVGDLAIKASLTYEWKVIAVHIFKGMHSFCLAEIARADVGDHHLPTAIELYMLDGKLYNYAICGGQLSPPEIGPFHEYAPIWQPTSADADPIPCKNLPLDKRIVGYEILVDDNSPVSVYLVQLERVPVLVAV